MTFPTAAAMITRRKSFGTSIGPVAAIAILSSSHAWVGFASPHDFAKTAEASFVPS
jgi:hypothetical protein